MGLAIIATFHAHCATVAIPTITFQAMTTAFIAIIAMFHANAATFAAFVAKVWA